MSTDPTNTTSLFVHGIDIDLEEEQIKQTVVEAFNEFGQAEITTGNVNLVTDHESGGWRKFCFVRVEPSVADAIVENFKNADQNDADFPLVVNIAQPKEDRSGGRSGGGNFRSNRGGNGGGYSRGGNGGGNSYSGGGNRRDW